MVESTTPVPHFPKRMLVTGGAGFIGCNFVRLALESDPALHITTLDALTYAGNRANLASVEALHGTRHRFIHGDICDQPLVERVFGEDAIDTVVHFAAESHVDRSIDGPAAFVRTNVDGTLSLLQAARKAWVTRRDVRFHHVSTDEVYGSLGPTGLFSENTAYDPSSPYSATKAASDHLVRAWHRTYGLPVTLSNCSNNYGPFQFPEKLIPLMIANALVGKALPVYGDGANVRDWLYVDDHCRAIELIVRRGAPGRTYNVGGMNEQRNLAIVHAICDLLDELRPAAKSRRSLITFVPDRPGHDLRYAIDFTRIRNELGWNPDESFATALRKTVLWYLDNVAWVDDITRTRYARTRLGGGP